jgi:hypothetical protein
LIRRYQDSGAVIYDMPGEFVININKVIIKIYPTDFAGIEMVKIFPRQSGLVK